MRLLFFCQTSSPCPVVSLTCLYFCCCCCSPFFGVKKDTHSHTQAHICMLSYSFFSSLLGAALLCLEIYAQKHRLPSSPPFEWLSPPHSWPDTHSPVVQLSNYFHSHLPDWKDATVLQKSPTESMMSSPPLTSLPSLSASVSLSLSLHLPLPSIPFIYTHKSRWEGDIFNQKRKKYGSINPATPTIIMLGLCECLYLHTFVFRYTNVNVCVCVQSLKYAYA